LPQDLRHERHRNRPFADRPPSSATICVRVRTWIAGFLLDSSDQTNAADLARGAFTYAPPTLGPLSALWKSTDALPT
jgi:hypothetical protein